MEIEFKMEDWRLLYTVLKQRVGSNNSLEHAERFNAFSMMSRNLFGVFALGFLLQILKLILQGFNSYQLLLAILSLILAVIGYKTFIWYWNLCTERLFGHVLAYGNNLDTFLANDQPKWMVRVKDSEE